MDEELLQSVYMNDLDTVKGLIKRNEVSQSGLKAALHAAVSLAGDAQTEIMTQLLTTNVDLNAKNVEGRTVLHTVVEALHWSPRHLDSLKTLLVAPGVDLNSQDHFGDTPLHIAAVNGSIDAVRVILTHSPDVMLTNSLGETPLDAAAKQGHQEIVRKISDVALIKSVCSGNLSKVKTLLKDATVTPNGLKEAFHAASSLLGGPQIEILKTIIITGVDINAKSDDGRNALHKCIEGLQLTYNHMDTLRLLVKQKGIDINAQDHYGLTPLHVAASIGNRDAIACLLDNGANINLKNCRGENPLDFASRRGQRAVIDELAQAYQQGTKEVDQATATVDAEEGEGGHERDRQMNNFGLAQKQVIIGSGR